MRRTSLRRPLAIGLALATAATLAAPATALIAGPAAAQGPYEVGQTMEFAFPEGTFGAYGASGPQDFRGKPVLLVVWGVKEEDSIMMSVPLALRLQQKFEDRLQVILVEAQEEDPDRAIAWAMKRGWMETRAIHTAGNPFQTGSGGKIPGFSLADPGGRVVLSGDPNQQSSQITKAIEAALESRARYPGLPEDVAEVYEDLDDHEYARAAEAAADYHEDAEPAEAAQHDLPGAVRQRVEDRIRRARWLLGNGYPERAEELADALAKGVRGDDALEELVAPLEEHLESEEAEPEFDAGKDLARLMPRVLEDPLDERVREKLADLAEEHDGTQVAARARRLLKLAELASTL